MEKELKKKLKVYSNIFKEAQEKEKKEADVVMYLVQFFKTVLGYDIFKEISKEYQIKGKYCDIAIKIKGQVEMLIEVKKSGMRLVDRHIEQAEIYAMKSGTKWVLLTNGCDWRLFHLSFDEEGGIESTLAFKTDLLKALREKPDDVIDKFKLLHRKNFTRELEIFWKKKTMLIPHALSKALFTEEVLRAISREVNRGADVKVGIEDTAKALKNMFDKEVLADMADLRIRKSKRAKKPKTLPEKPAKVSFTGKVPERIKLFHEIFDVKFWRDIFLVTAETLIKKNPEAFDTLADTKIMKGETRTYLSKDKSLIYYPRQLSNGLFLDVNLSANKIYSLILILLNGCGYKETDIKIFVKD